MKYEIVFVFLGIEFGSGLLEKTLASEASLKLAEKGINSVYRREVTEHSPIPEGWLEAENSNGWRQHRDFPFSEWTAEAGNGDTRLGYEEWVQHQIEMAGDDEKELNGTKEACINT